MIHMTLLVFEFTEKNLTWQNIELINDDFHLYL